MLRPGGYLLYSTCTFSLEENEKVIDDFLEEYPDMELCPVEPYEGFAPGVSVGAGDLSACVHIYPHRMEGEGHFLALCMLVGRRPISSHKKQQQQHQKQTELIRNKHVITVPAPSILPK